MSEKLQLVAKVYDDRAPKYDSEGAFQFHATQSTDFLKWLSLQPSDNVLDLACGTGGMLIPAKQQIGPKGRAVGVDISGESLKIAKAKAEKLGLEVELFEHDISRVNDIQGIEEAGFDVIICASALILLDDPRAAVLAWAKLLKPGGRLIFDIPTKDALVRGLVLSRVAKELGIHILWDRTKTESKELMRSWLIEAGLNTEASFTTEDYGAVKYIDALNGEQAFEDMYSGKAGGIFKLWYADVNVSPRRQEAKDLFAKELKKLAGPEGKIGEHQNFHIGIGKKE